jgi:hypothetical protein
VFAAEWPPWITLGGSPGSTAAGSEWQTWLTFAEGLAVFAASLWIAGTWWRAAGQAPRRSQRWWAKVDLALHYAVGGFAVGGLRCLMIWVPAWAVFHLSMLALFALLLKYAWDRRHLRVTFVPAGTLAALERERHAARSAQAAAEREKEEAHRQLWEEFERRGRENAKLSAKLAEMREAAVRLQERAEQRHDAELEAEAVSIRQAIHDIRDRM